MKDDLINRHVIGCMTGTSCDGVDVALVSVKGHGLSMEPTFMEWKHLPWSDREKDTWLRACRGEKLSAEVWVRLAESAAQHHLQAIRSLPSYEKAELVVVHGQTVFHRPPYSWQLASLPTLAQSLNKDIVGDLRGADLAAGGQGAPITPLADWLFLRSSDHERFVINLGGFINLTYLPQNAGVDQVSGQDLCACNQLLDHYCQQKTGLAFDKDGRLAKSGSPAENIAMNLVDILGKQGKQKHSLGSGDESSYLVEQLLSSLAPPDALATLADAIARTVVRACSAQSKAPIELLIAGGGWNNLYLQERLIHHGKLCNMKVMASDDAGLPGEAREAAAMAVLGLLCRDRVPITITQVTGVIKAPLAGVWAYAPYPS